MLLQAAPKQLKRVHALRLLVAVLKRMHGPHHLDLFPQGYGFLFCPDLNRACFDLDPMISEV